VQHFFINSSWEYCGLWRLKSRTGVILQQTAVMSIAVLFLGLYLNFSKVQHGTEQGGRVDNYQREEQVELDQMYVLKLGGGSDLYKSNLVDFALYERICWWPWRIGHDIGDYEIVLACITT
jgi:hypothetical protein